MAQAQDAKPHFVLGFCRDCLYWDQVSCHYNPPGPGGWPHTDAFSWCAHFEENSSGEQPVDPEVDPEAQSAKR